MMKNFFKSIFEKIKKYNENHSYSCDFCGKEIFDYPKERLCKPCEKNLIKTKEPFCEKCGRKTRAQGVCLDCKSKLPSFTQGLSPFPYEGYASVLINRFKNGKRRLSGLLGERMAERFLQTHQNEQALLLVPVPLTKPKQTARGYNQAHELAKSMENYFLSRGIRAQTDHEILQKTRETSFQKNLGLFERLENVSGAYHVHKRTACKDKTVLLIDDIMTTGATGSECADKLLRAGAKKVYFVVAAAMPEQSVVIKSAVLQ